MQFEIQGKNFLVTGANRGIGKAILEAAIEHGAAKVYAAVRRLDSAQPLVSEHGDRVVPVRLDLEDADTIQAAAREADDVDVVINNAGILKNASPLDDEAIELFESELAVNVFGLIRMAQAFAPVLASNGGGAFVQLNSVASLKAFPEVATYSASKAASYSITQSLRELFKVHGTRVVSVHPGPIATDMASDAGLDEMAEPPSLVADAIFQALRQNEFHAFPDSLAQQVGQAYQGFAEAILDVSPGELSGT